MQTYQPGMVKQKATDILGAPPRSGHFSVYAQKLSAQIFVWICSITVWGHVVNHASIRKECLSHCGFQISFAFLAWLEITLILLFNYLAESSPKWRNGCFSHSTEAQLTAILIFLWIPPVISVSLYESAPVLAIWFSWLGFIASMYATYKAYHSFKEEDLPTHLPHGFDEEDYVYG